jgi:hypothetical protein
VVSLTAWDFSGSGLRVSYKTVSAQLCKKLRIKFLETAEKRQEEREACCIGNGEETDLTRMSKACGLTRFWLRRNYQGTDDIP